jgi:hypothetical protein
MNQQRSTPAINYIFILLLGAAAFSSRGQALHEVPPWKDEVAKGYFPYHRLVTDDFPINDHVHSENGKYTRGFFHYRYKDHWITQNGHTVDRVTEWLVWSGFDRNKSSRRSWFKPIDETLPHEQCHLDINELYSRQLAEMPLEKLPIGEGVSSQEACADLSRKLQALADHISAEAKTEQDRYDAETSHGKNVSGQEKSSAAIQARLKRAGIHF